MAFSDEEKDELKDKFLKEYRKTKTISTAISKINVGRTKLYEWFREDFSQRIQVFRGEDWRVEQSDNKTFVLEQGKQYTIPKKCFHRIKKGNDTLVLRVEFI